MRNRERSAGSITSSKKRDFCQIHPSDTWYRSIANSAPDNFFQSYKTKPFLAAGGLLRRRLCKAALLELTPSHSPGLWTKGQSPCGSIWACVCGPSEMCTHVRANVLFLTPSVNVTSMLSNLIHNLSSIKHGHRSIRI